MKYFRGVKNTEIAIGEGYSEGKGEIGRIVKRKMEENRHRRNRFEESLGEIKRELNGMRSREEEWKRERDRMKERIQTVERRLEEKIEEMESSE